MFIALSLDLEDFKTAVLQVREILLQSAMEFVLQLRHLLGRRQDPCVYAIRTFSCSCRK